MIDFKALMAPPARPLPVMATFLRAYQLLWQNRSLIMHIGWIPLILLAVGEALQLRIIGDAQSQKEIAEAFKVAPMDEKLSSSITALAGMAMLFACNVSWRRFLLINEPPSAFYFARPFWRYIGLSISFSAGFVVCSLLAILVMTVLLTVGLKDRPELASPLLIAFAIVTVVVIIAWLIRHILMFTAVTVDNRDLQWKDASIPMRGNVFRYIATFLLIMAPPILVGFVINGIIALLGVDSQSIPGALLSGGIQSLLSLVQIILGSSMAALIYDLLIRGGGPKIDY